RMCCHCKGKKTLPKKFSSENNMDPGKIPEELQGLTELKANNRYYADIIIDNEVLEFLPQEGYIDGQLPQVQPN
ncbi:2152_t:CDS:2, partial [Gigaspora rosea]